MPLNRGKIMMYVVIDKPAVERARDYLAERLNGAIADPVLVAEAIEQILRAGPLVRWIAAPFTDEGQC